MDNKEPDYDVKLVEQMNQKAIENQFFTPDNIYIELGLFKDLPIGAVYADQIVFKDDAQLFRQTQNKLLDVLVAYQKRVYDTVEPHFQSIGYTDADIDRLFEDKRYHDAIFLTAPTTKFLNTLSKHILRNQNNSRPAEKYEKKYIDKSHFTLEPIEVTCRINTYPLTLSTKIMESLGKELGEALGVNIAFMNKDPMTFDQSDWDEWLEKVDCFYLDSLGRFMRSPFIHKKQGDMQFAGCYIFARKRFERCVMNIMRQEDFEQQVQMASAMLGMCSDFEWLQNNDVRLTDEVEQSEVEETEDLEEPVST